jgi:hypothetical protein
MGQTMIFHTSVSRETAGSEFWGASSVSGDELSGICVGYVAATDDHAVLT